MRVHCVVNGILTRPGEARNWTGRAVTWTHLHTDAKAEKVEYWAGPLDRIFGQKARAQKLYKTLSYYAGHQLTLSGHSNGCDVILDMLRDYPDCPRIGRLNLVSAACESDFDKNGLNDHLIGGHVGEVRVFCGGQDKALALAHTWAGRLLGYGTLGLDGPQHVAPEVADRVGCLTWTQWGHSTCWEDAHFDQTMRELFLAL